MSLDISFFYLLHDLAGRSPAGDATIVFVAKYLPYAIVVAFIAFVALRGRGNREKLEVLLIGAGAAVVARLGFVEAIRAWYHRPRPFLTLPVESLLPDPAWSFPSGHMSFFFALSTVVFLYDRAWGTAFFVLSALVGFGRVAAGVHYPSDILGGIALGVAVGWAVAKLGRFLSSKIVTGTY